MSEIEYQVYKRHCVFSQRYSATCVEKEEAIEGSEKRMVDLSMFGCSDSSFYFDDIDIIIGILTELKKRVNDDLPEPDCEEVK